MLSLSIIFVSLLCISLWFCWLCICGSGSSCRCLWFDRCSGLGFGWSRCLTGCFLGIRVFVFVESRLSLAGLGFLYRSHSFFSFNFVCGCVLVALHFLLVFDGVLLVGRGSAAEVSDVRNGLDFGFIFDLVPYVEPVKGHVGIHVGELVKVFHVQHHVAERANGIGDGFEECVELVHVAAVEAVLKFAELFGGLVEHLLYQRHSEVDDVLVVDAFEVAFVGEVEVLYNLVVVNETLLLRVLAGALECGSLLVPVDAHALAHEEGGHVVCGAVGDFLALRVVEVFEFDVLELHKFALDFQDLVELEFGNFVSPVFVFDHRFALGLQSLHFGCERVRIHVFHLKHFFFDVRLLDFDFRFVVVFK
mmetsp:Transcript_74952/g.162102  ORF Transcript_74952/g.162102 Transcript_74952/m.162102 type:complete len:362 (+) Transcript_74952:118-1203(+)